MEKSNGSKADVDKKAREAAKLLAARTEVGLIAEAMKEFEGAIVS
jgi:hypothetical protein